MEHATRVTSSVILVSRLDRSVEFYRSVFSCEAAIRERDAALLLAPGGFQIYLIALRRASHATGGIGLQCLIWAVESDAELRDMERTFHDYGAFTDTYTSGGVSFLEVCDPDGIRNLVAYPSPEELPRSVIGARLYA